MFKPALVITASSLVFAGAALAAYPSLTIVSPPQDQVIVSDKVTVKVSSPNFKFVDYKTYVKPAYGQGHIHLWLDQDNPTKVSAIKAISDSYTFDNVKPGTHTIVAELVANDHSSLNPKVVSTVSFKTTLPQSPTSSSNLIVMSVLSFLLVVLALYFISGSKTYTSPKKSSPKSAKRKSHK